MSSPRELYLRVLDGVTAVVECSDDRSWDIPSPCTGWSTQQLLGHLIDGQHQLNAMLTGQGPRPPITDPQALTHLTGDTPAMSWRRAHQATVAVLTHLDPTRIVETPLGKRAVPDVLSVAVIEPLIHAWDLAVATGQSVVLDPEAVAVTLAGVQVLGDQLQATGMYHPARVMAPDASAQDRLLAALGRDPSAGAFH